MAFYGLLRGYYIGMYPDNSIQVFRPEDFHPLYTLEVINKGPIGIDPGIDHPEDCP